MAFDCSAESGWTAHVWQCGRRGVHSTEEELQLLEDHRQTLSEELEELDGSGSEVSALRNATQDPQNRQTPLSS